MKVLYVIDSPYAWSGGCWFYRNHIPAKGLKGRGHEIRFMTIPAHGNVPEDYYNFPDTVVFSRTYPRDPLMIMREFKKRGKRVIYEIDDDLWDVNPDNPSVSISTEKNFQYENFMREVNAVTTTTETLANKIRKFNKNVYVVPNCIDYDIYKKREGNNKKLVVGYTGAASHWADLGIITDVVADLQAKYDFDFTLEGMCGSPIESEIYSFQQIKLLGLAPEKKAYYDTALAWWDKMKKVRFTHIPFHFPQLFPEILRRCNMDIGLAPLYDNEFNHSKSCLKFYEYASMGTVTLASDVLPYNKEVGYCAKNNYKDWYEKLEKLLTDEKFRLELQEKQSKWVEENRGLGKISMLWEKALDTHAINK